MEAKAFNLHKCLKEKEAEHTKAMAEVLEDAAANYGALEKEHFNAISNMKVVEEQAKTEAKQKTKMEVEIIQLQEKIRNLEAKCIRSIGEAQEEGKREGKQEGKQEVLGEVKEQLQGVFNRGFRDGWKSALKKAAVPDSLDLFLRDQTPLPYPKAGLKDSDNEEDKDDEDDEDDADESEEAGGEQDYLVADPSPAPTDDPPAPLGSAPVDPAPANDPPAPLGPVPVDPTPPSES